MHEAADGNDVGGQDGNASTGVDRIQGSRRAKVDASNKRAHHERDSDCSDRNVETRGDLRTISGEKSDSQDGARL